MNFGALFWSRILWPKKHAVFRAICFFFLYCKMHPMDKQFAKISDCENICCTNCLNLNEIWIVVNWFARWQLNKRGKFRELEKAYTNSHLNFGSRKRTPILKNVFLKPMSRKNHHIHRSLFGRKRCVANLWFRFFACEIVLQHKTRAI